MVPKAIFITVPVLFFSVLELDIFRRHHIGAVLTPVLAFYEGLSELYFLCQGKGWKCESRARGDKARFDPVLQLRDVYPGSEFFPSRIPDPHQRI